MDDRGWIIGAVGRSAIREKYGYLQRASRRRRMPPGSGGLASPSLRRACMTSARPILRRGTAGRGPTGGNAVLYWTMLESGCGMALAREPPSDWRREPDQQQGADGGPDVVGDRRDQERQ